MLIKTKTSTPRLATSGAQQHREIRPPPGTVIRKPVPLPETPAHNRVTDRGPSRRAAGRLYHTPVVDVHSVRSVWFRRLGYPQPARRPHAVRHASPPQGAASLAGGPPRPGAAEPGALLAGGLLRLAFWLRATVFIIADSENYFLPGFQLARASASASRPAARRSTRSSSPAWSTGSDRIWLRWRWPSTCSAWSPSA